MYNVPTGYVQDICLQIRRASASNIFPESASTDLQDDRVMRSISKNFIALKPSKRAVLQESILQCFDLLPSCGTVILNE